MSTIVHVREVGSQSNVHVDQSLLLGFLILPPLNNLSVCFQNEKPYTFATLSQRLIAKLVPKGALDQYPNVPPTYTI